MATERNIIGYKYKVIGSDGLIPVNAKYLHEETTRRDIDLVSIEFLVGHAILEPVYDTSNEKKVEPDEELVILKAKHDILCELWVPESSHDTHIKIGELVRKYASQILDRGGSII